MHRGGESMLGLLQATELAERAAAGEVELEAAHAEQLRPREQRQRLLGPLELREQRAELAMEESIGGIEGERLAVGAFGLEQAVLVGEHEAERRPAVGARAVGVDQGAALDLRLAVASEAVERQHQPVARTALAGRELQHPAVDTLGLLEAA